MNPNGKLRRKNNMKKEYEFTVTEPLYNNEYAKYFYKKS